MIIGNGMMATTFSKYENINNVLIFASGVSNSKSQNRGDFEREKNMLKTALKSNQESKFVYFSSCSVYDDSLKESLYVQHKLQMEEMISQSSTRHLILRLPQVFGAKSNPTTILPFFCRSIVSGNLILIHKNATRYIIDVCDVLNFAQPIIDNQDINNQTVNIAYDNKLSARAVLALCETALRKPAISELVPGGHPYTIPFDSQLIPHGSWDPDLAVTKIREYSALWL